MVVSLSNISVVVKVELALVSKLVSYVVSYETSSLGEDTSSIGTVTQTKHQI